MAVAHRVPVVPCSGRRPGESTLCSQTPRRAGSGSEWVYGWQVGAVRWQQLVQFEDPMNGLLNPDDYEKGQGSPANIS